MNKLKMTLLAFASILAFSGIAQATAENVKSKLSTNNSSIDIISVEQVFNGPVYEVVHKTPGGNQIIYILGEADTVVIGNLVDVKTGVNITTNRISEVNPIPWSSLPLERAIKSGSGSLKLAVFSDPDCPYCAQLEKTLNSLEGVTVYTFLFPLESIHPDSKRKSISIWCAEDPHQELTNVMLLGKETKIDPSKIKDCDGFDVITKNIDFGKSIGIHGTPTLISGDGRKGGALRTAGDLKAWLENYKK